MVSNSPIDHVIESASYVNEHSKFVKINNDKILEFIKNINKDEYEAKSSVVQFPLNFSNAQQEANFWFTLDLINFGSGFRKELHELSGRGAYETICYGLFGMFLSQSGNLSAKFLGGLSLNEVGSYFSIPAQVEFELQPGIYSYKDSPLKPLILKIQKVLKESSEAMEELGYKDFGEFIWKITDPKSTQQPPLASEFIEKILDKIPAFRDTATLGDHKIYIYKKVQLLAADLYRRFKDTIPDRFGFQDVDKITVFTDNVLPAVLRHFGILQVDPELETEINESKELQSGSQKEVELRVQAIQACLVIINVANQSSETSFIKNSMKLDYYLWTKGKDESIRKFERHICKDTVYY
ncbi:hypothetical protein DLAC_09670 [Tieghemostelium lacteum]|uniref:Queuosine 5'-phosphate N-glycosylase/hydrolase n=1 Tax=Tieghemostelium lacteum TaxID=361077 RepID=A0A151Z6W4_TIELA|nr:hypothetical protein DLAC_09670 [Tieghemostelium lacteum]|eukprot:KYQ89702.1 hypothetical protein DLAC_09670 [Tieghemostelium lacteum]